MTSLDSSAIAYPSSEPATDALPNRQLGNILGTLAEEVSHEEILKGFPYLEPDDIKAAPAYAARQADQAVLQSA